MIQPPISLLLVKVCDFFPFFSQVLQLIYWSRNGLTVSELSQLTALPPCALLYLLHELKRRSILSEIGGLYHLSHDQVSSKNHGIALPFHDVAML